MQTSVVRLRGRTIGGYFGGAVAVLLGLGVCNTNAADLTWDSTGSSPTAPQDGSGTWDTVQPLWSNTTADGLWSDPNTAVIGSGTGTDAYTITLGQNISPSAVQFNNPGTGAAYTVATGAYSLAVAGNISLNAAAVTLQGTVSAQQIVGDTSTATLKFDGVTLEPTVASTYANSFITGTTDSFGNPLASISAGGLTVDTSAVTNGVVTITDPLATDPNIAPAADGGLTKTGTGTLVLGSDENGYDTAYGYTGPTTVNAGTLSLDTSANSSFFNSFNPTGPFATSGFVVNSGAVLSVWSPSAIDGQSGSIPVTINGGTLTTADIDGDIGSAYLANVTLNGGTISSDVSGSFEFMPSSVLEVTASGLLSAQSVAFDGGATIQVDADATLMVSSNLVDGETAGQITKTGPGTLLLQGTSNSYFGDTTISAGTLTLADGASLSGAGNISVASGATFNLNGTAGTQNILISGAVNLGPNPGSGILVRQLNTVFSLEASSAILTVMSASDHANRQLVILGATASTPLVFAGSTNAWQGTLDLTNNDLDIEHGNLATITNQIKEGFNGGTWTGQGINSSAAAADTSHLTALGAIVNNDGNGHAVYGSATTMGLFDSISPATTDVLVKYTYYGDANLDGQVDGSDYTLIDAGFDSQSTDTPLTGWYNGDFNYDGKIDGSDFTLIDNAFNTQGVNLSSAGVIAAGAAGFGSTVPEPASIGILGLGSLIWLRKRRRMV